MVEAAATRDVDPRIIAWLAAQALHDRDARLVDGGGDLDDRVELANLFIDLPVSYMPDAPHRRHEQTTAVKALLRAFTVGEGRGGRVLLMGGPGTGKSTVTTMLAQVLRMPWLDAHVGVLPTALQEQWARARDALASLIAAQEWSSPKRVLPLRVNLPSLARWMATHRGEHPTLWEHLASRMSDELATHQLPGDITAQRLQELAHDMGPIAWILDGLDEVPRTAGRAEVIEVVRATVCERAPAIAGVVVTTRPQGYEGEFDDLDEMGLQPLPSTLAYEYGERLITAWAKRRADTDRAARLDELRREFTKPDVAVLLQTPLHTTIAALLVAERGTLPKSRYQLFKDYFSKVLRREFKKRVVDGVADEDEGVIRTLHANAGLLLHTRSQAQPGARASLRRRELRELLGGIYGALGYKGDELRGRVERILRFASERLVLLIHDMEGEFTFGVRSLQEFFAAEALAPAEDDIADVTRRLDAVLRSSHWGNVVAFVVSRCALAATPGEQRRALQLTVERCRALNRGDAGEAPARCLLGSHLALAMLRETDGYASPWLSDALWDVAFQASAAPTQDESARVIERERLGSRARLETWWDGVEIHVRLGMTAACQGGDAGAHRRWQIRDAAAALFARGGESTLVAWRLLNGLLVAGDTEAEQLVAQYAPTTEEEAWAAFNAAAYVGDYVMPAWWCDFVNANPLWFTPGRLTRCFRGSDLQRPVTAFDVLEGLLDKHDEISLEFVEYEGRIVLTSIKPRRSMSDDIPLVSAAWRIWQTLATFLCAPSQFVLADILDACAEPAVLHELLPVSRRLPWPISACVMHVLAFGRPDLLAQRLRECTLGTADDWHAAETRWQVNGVVSSAELHSMLGSTDPWSREIATRGIPIPSHFLDYDDGSMFVQWIDAHPDQTDLAVRLLAASRNLFYAPLRVHRLLETRDFNDIPPMSWAPIVIFTDFDTPDREGWFQLLDARGRGGLHGVLNDNLPPSRSSARALLQRYVERPDQWGLLDAITSVVGALPDLARDALSLPPPPADAPRRAHAQHALIKLCLGGIDDAEVPALLASLRWGDAPSIDLRGALAIALRSPASDGSRSERLLLAALDATPPPAPSVRDALLGALFANARRLPTPAFATLDAWQYCTLPEPFLTGQPTTRRPPALASLDTLRNVKLFAETPAVDVPFTRPQDDRGQWIVLVGQNGVGKTTLLRALALALVNPTVASKLLDERIPMMRNGQEARIAATFDTGRYEVAIRREGRTETVIPIARPADEPPWVVAYGVRRGSALGEKDRTPEPGAVGELHTLFERPAALHAATQWLLNLDADVLREQRRSPRREGAPPGPREAVWRAVVHALRSLLGVTKVEVEEAGAVYVTHPELGRVPFEAMSDGYLGTAGWLIDMIARWIDRQQELDEPVGGNLLQQMCGLALLDEIDLHLHPMWQLRIIEDVRRLFPRMSFVVTTHNPLALHGARAGEIYVMRRERGNIELTRRDILPGRDVDRVLLDQFGVEHTLDQETRDRLAQHRKLVERAVAPSDPERRRLEAWIVERFGDVGSTLRDERNASDGSPLRSDEQEILNGFPKKA